MAATRSDLTDVIRTWAESRLAMNFMLFIAAAALLWDYRATAQRDARILETVGVIETRQIDLSESVIAQQTALQEAIRNASQSRKQIVDTLEHRVESLEGDHRWFFEARASAHDVSPDDGVVRQLEAALGRAMIAAKENLDRALAAEAELEKLR